MEDGRKKVQKLYGDRLEEQIWIHRWLECRGQVKQLEQHNKSREQTDWLEELGLRLWKQSRTWSEAESREQNLEVLKSSWTGRFWKLDIE